MLKGLLILSFGFLAACGASESVAPKVEQAQKAAALGVTIENFEDASPVLLAVSRYNDRLFAALSLRADHPRAVKRQLRAEVTHVALDCVQSFADTEPDYARAFDRYNERLMERAGKDETEAQREAFEKAFKSRMRAKLNGMVDLSPLIPAELAADDGLGKSKAGASHVECEAFMRQLSAQRFEFR
jgi:hypothetical protein